MTHRNCPRVSSAFLAAWDANAADVCTKPITRRRSTTPAASGLIAALDGKKRRDIVQAGIDALKAVWHRGAVDADGKTGDGAGIHIEIPQDFFADEIERGGDGAARRPDRGRPGVPAEDRLSAPGTLPPDRRDRNPEFRLPHLWLAPGADQCRRASARRPTPPAPRSSRSCSGTPAACRKTMFERELYIIRRKIEKARDRGADPRALHLLAVLPLDHL